MSVLFFGCEQKPSPSRILAEKNIKHEELKNAAFRVTFDTPYFYGDRVSFDGINGKGTGTVVDICLMEDGQVYYTIGLDGSDEMQGGVYSKSIKLISRPKVKKKE